MVIYMDDVIIAAKKQEQIDNLLVSLENGTNIDTGK